ncbi:MAG: hypothetical protein WKF53_14960 [Rubrobacter sp.]
MARRQIPVLQESSAPASRTIDIGDEERAGPLVALGRALSDPNRVTMLGMLAYGRGCCELPDCGAFQTGIRTPASASASSRDTSM